MRTQQRMYTTERGWTIPRGEFLPSENTLVLAFGARELLNDSSVMGEVHNSFPNALIIGCSSAGEICDTRVLDQALVVTAASFSHTGLQLAEAMVNGDQGEGDQSEQAGIQLGRQLASDELTHVLVLSDGLRVNGSDLVRGLSRELPSRVAITGGLAGDGDRFQETCVYCRNDASPGRIVAVGFRGDRLRVGYGSLGGWDSFGPERTVTRAAKNVLYELDGEPALDLYKRYLGEHAQGLPATGLRFPLAVKASPESTPVVRTMLSVDPKEKSVTFAADIPVGSIAKLMRANFDRLVDGASGAALIGRQALRRESAQLALLISCVGRKLILKQRTEEEVEAVRATLGVQPTLAGFYSYGEISPFSPSAKCELHNQTMTITAFSEVD